MSIFDRLFGRKKAPPTAQNGPVSKGQSVQRTKRFTSGCRLCGSPFVDNIITLRLSDPTDRQQIQVGMWMCPECIKELTPLAPTARFNRLRNGDVQLYYGGELTAFSRVRSIFSDKRLAQCFFGGVTLSPPGTVRSGPNSFLVDDFEVVITPADNTPYRLSEADGSDLAEIAEHLGEGRHMVEYDGINYWALVRWYDR